MTIGLPDDRIVFLIITMIGFLITWMVLPSRTSREQGVRWRGHPIPTTWRHRGDETGAAAERGRTDHGDVGFARRVIERRSGRRTREREPWMRVLGVDASVDARGLRAAYVARMREIHPDSLGVAFGDQSAKSAECVDAYAMGRAWLARMASGSAVSTE